MLEYDSYNSLKTAIKAVKNKGHIFINYANYIYNIVACLAR